MSGQNNLVIIQNTARISSHGTSNSSPHLPKLLNTLLDLAFIFKPKEDTVRSNRFRIYRHYSYRLSDLRPGLTQHLHQNLFFLLALQTSNARSSFFLYLQSFDYTT